MRVAAVNLTGGGMSGGYRKYLLALVPLLRRERDLDLEVYVPPDLVASLAVHGLADLRTWPHGDHRRGFRGLRAALRQTAPDVVFTVSHHVADFLTRRWETRRDEDRRRLPRRRAVCATGFG